MGEMRRTDTLYVCPRARVTSVRSSIREALKRIEKKVIARLPNVAQEDGEGERQGRGAAVGELRP